VAESANHQLVVLRETAPSLCFRLTASESKGWASRCGGSPWCSWLRQEGSR